MSKHKKRVIIVKGDGDHDIEKELEEHCNCGDECECDCGCDCCGDGIHFHRQFLTKEEQIELLEEYLKELKLGVQAVEENLADLKK